MKSTITYLVVDEEAGLDSHFGWEDNDVEFEVWVSDQLIDAN